MNTRKEVINNIREKIRMEVSSEFNIIFFENNHEPCQNNGLKKETNQQEFINALSSVIMLLIIYL